MLCCVQRFMFFCESRNNIAPFTISGEINNKINRNLSPYIRYFLAFTLVGVYSFYLNAEISSAFSNKNICFMSMI